MLFYVMNVTYIVVKYIQYS